MSLSRRSLFTMSAAAALVPAVASATPGMDSRARDGRPALIFKPGKIPVDENGKGHVKHYPNSQTGIVYVDGQKHELVMEANEVRGYIVKYVKEGQGAALKLVDGELVTEIITGFVEVRAA